MAFFKKRTKPIRLESVDQLMELVGAGKPVFVDFWQHNCQPCRTMDGIVNELADDFSESAIVVKANAAEAGDAFVKFNVRSTPTFMILTGTPDSSSAAIHQRYRATGLVKKDILTSNLESAITAVSS